MIYHLTTPEAWAKAQALGRHIPDSLLERDGFIHASSREQLLGSAAKHFAGVDELLVLAIDEDEDVVGAPVVWEDTSGSGQRFPHIFGALPVSAVRAVVPLRRGRDGRFGPLPRELP